MKRYNLCILILTVKRRRIIQPRHEQRYNVKILRHLIFRSSIQSQPQKRTFWDSQRSEERPVKRRMSSWVCSYVTRNVVNSHPFLFTQHFDFPATIRRRTVSFPVTYAPKFPSLKLRRSQSSTHEGEGDPESFVQALTIPEEWLLPSRAIEVISSNWL